MIGLILILSIFLVGAVALIKNQINYSIRLKWLDEVFSSPNWHEMHQIYNLYDYNSTFWDWKLWKYKPLKDYIESR